jgi:SnoaL-like domain
MDEAEQRDLIARYMAAYNRFDVDGMLALLTAGVRVENVSGGQVTASASGAAEFHTLAERAAALFSEREQRVTGVEFRGGIAVASIAYRYSSYSASRSRAGRSSRSTWSPTPPASANSPWRFSMTMMVTRWALARPRACQHPGTCRNFGGRASALASRSPAVTEPHGPAFGS